MPRHELPTYIRLSLISKNGDETFIAALPAVVGGRSVADDDTGPMWDLRLDSADGRLTACPLKGAMQINGRPCEGTTVVQNGDCLCVGETIYTVQLQTRWKPRSRSERAIGNKMAVPYRSAIEVAD